MKSDPHAATVARDEDVSQARPVLGGRYEILGLLGAGGMGNVYKARDRELDELVALKVLKPELVATPGSLERFRREVKLARKVTHPNIARVFDIGEHGGDKILTMELVDGEPLSNLVERDGALPIGRVVEIASTIAAAVGAAHDAGVIHRDLKPDNVLVAKDGRVVVTDFGIARAASGDGTKTGGFVGTPTYMAPEQVEDGAPIDARTDIYAFGALVYELLTGQPAWTGESVFSVAAARLLRPPPDPAAKRPDLPAALATLVLRCMARQPADRPASMPAVVEALAKITLPPGGTNPLARVRTNDGLVDANDVKRVAVLPFEEQGLGEQRYVADGLSEDLIDALSAARGLRVTSRGAVLRYKGGGRDAREVGRELSVAFVVEGSIRRAASGFRIAVRLVSVTDGFQLWTRRFEVNDAGLLVENDAIAHAIASALSVELAPAPVLRDDPVAVDLYLRARDAVKHAFTTDPTRAATVLEEALARTPDEPRLLAAYATTAGRLPVQPPPLRQRLLDAASRAIDLAPRLPDGYVAQGIVLDFVMGDFPGAVGPLRRALELAPNNATAHASLGYVLTYVHHPSARAHLERSLALDPGNEPALLALSVHFALEGEWDAAHACIGGMPAAFRFPVQARVAFWRRDVAMARELLQQLDHIGFSPHRASIQACLGATINQARTFDELAASLPDRSILAAELRSFLDEMEADIAANAGDREQVLEVLRRADSEGYARLLWVDGSPLLEPLRKDPVFLGIRARVAERAARVAVAYEAPLHA